MRLQNEDLLEELQELQDQKRELMEERVEAEEAALSALQVSSTDLESLNRPALRKIIVELVKLYKSLEMKCEGFAKDMGNVDSLKAKFSELELSHAELLLAHKEQSSRLSSLQNENDKIPKYKQTIVTQEKIIEKMQKVLESRAKKEKLSESLSSTALPLTSTWSSLDNSLVPKKIEDDIKVKKLNEDIKVMIKELEKKDAVIVRLQEELNQLKAGKDTGIGDSSIDTRLSSLENLVRSMATLGPATASLEDSSPEGPLLSSPVTIRSKVSPVTVLPTNSSKDAISLKIRGEANGQVDTLEQKMSVKQSTGSLKVGDSFSFRIYLIEAS